MVNMLQLFDAEQKSLLSFGSGFVIVENVSGCLLEAKRSGEDQFQAFVNN